MSYYSSQGNRRSHKRVLPKQIDIRVPDDPRPSIPEYSPEELKAVLKTAFNAWEEMEPTHGEVIEVHPEAVPIALAEYQGYTIVTLKGRIAIMDPDGLILRGRFKNEANALKKIKKLLKESEE